MMVQLYGCFQQKESVLIRVHLVKSLRFRLDLKNYVFNCTSTAYWITPLVNMQCDHFKVEASFRWLRSVSAVKLFCWPSGISKFNCICMSGTSIKLRAVIDESPVLCIDGERCQLPNVLSTASLSDSSKLWTRKWYGSWRNIAFLKVDYVLEVEMSWHMLHVRL